MKIISYRHLLIFLCLLSVLDGCSELLTPASEQSLPYANANANSVSFRVSLLGATEPELIKNELIPITDASLQAAPFFSDTGINVDLSGNVMIAWDLHSRTTPGEYPPHFSYRTNNTAVWQDSLPIPPLLQASVDKLSVSMQPQSGVIYVAWSDLCEPDCSNVYSSRFEPLTGWQTETLHGLGSEIQVLTDFQSNATAIWKNSSNETSSLSFSAQHFQANIGWDVPQSFATEILPITNPLPPVAAEPLPIASTAISISSVSHAFFDAAVDLQGDSLLVWNYYDSNSPNAYQYGSVEFSTINGWQKKQLSRFYSSDPVSGAEVMVAASTTPGTFEVIADGNITDITGETKNQIHSSAYINGKWASVKNIAQPRATHYSAAVPYKAEANSIGDIVLAWIENDGQQSSVYSNYYSHTNGWMGVQRIYGPILDLPLEAQPVVDSNAVLDKLSASINFNGSAIISWVDNASIDARILLTKFDKTSGWKPIVLAAQVDGRAEYIDSLKTSLDINDRVYLVWNQVALLVDNWESKIYLSEDDYAAYPIALLSRGSILNTPPIPKQSVNWSEINRLWNAYPGIGTSAFTSEVQMIESDKVSLIFAYQPQFDRENKEVHSISNDPQSKQWKHEQLAINNTPSEIVKTDINNNSKNTFAVFRSGNAIFINRKRQNLNWSEEHAVYSGMLGDYDVYALQDAGAIVIASPTPEQNSLSFREIQYIAGAPQFGVTNQQSIAGAKIIAKSVINSADQIFSLWLNSQETSPGIFVFSLQISKYDLSNGWDVSSPILNVTTIDVGKSLLLEVTKLDEPLVIAVDLEGHLVSSVLSATNGWSNWVNIDNNITSGDILMGIPSLATNVNHDAMLLWTEEEISTTGVEHAIYTSQLNDPVAGVAPSWSAPQRVAATKHPGQQQSARLVLADDGNAFAFWPLSLVDRTAVATNKFIAGIGWNADVDVVRLYEYDDIPLVVISSIDATIVRNEITISWIERNLYNDGEISLWASTSSF